MENTSMIPSTEQSPEQLPTVKEPTPPIDMQNTADVVHEHLADEEHQISEDDIATAATLPGELAAAKPAQNPAAVKANNEETPDPSSDDKDIPVVTPWNILGS